MSNILIREPRIEDKAAFISAMQLSQALHHPWVEAPTTAEEFDQYLQHYQQSNQKSFLVFNASESIVGVFNVNEIIRALFQNAYLGFYGVADFSGEGYMSAGLKLVVTKVFNELGLHRIEANIQPANSKSIQLVKNNGFRYEGFSPRYLKIDNEWRGHEHWAMTYEDFIRNDADVLRKDHVEIVAYDSKWPMEADLEISQLREVLPLAKVIDIQHIGSTAIPGMAAKPILDIQIAVASLEEMKIIAIPALQKLGYEYWYENPDPERLFFVKGMPPFGEKRTHHVHIVEPTSKHWRGKINFRDYLIACPEIAKEYQALKTQLAKQYTCDREEYTNAKGEFVNRILKLAEENSDR
ncbi:MAG: GNAT family N-acetyltransferase [Gammaproteobacteria bacterium]|nr:GNAT family N-acetyltransferase [Gammaproteobacteria bacterium]